MGYQSVYVLAPSYRDYAKWVFNLPPQVEQIFYLCHIHNPLDVLSMRDCLLVELEGWSELPLEQRYPIKHYLKTRRGVIRFSSADLIETALELSSPAERMAVYNPYDLKE